MTRFELVTSPLPRECSAPELHGRYPPANRLFNMPSGHLTPFSTTLHNSGAGEGNRTLVISLEGFCSTIELHPQNAAFRLIALTRPRNYPWWRGKDSNLRRQSRQIYSLIPLTAREPLQINRKLSFLWGSLSTPKHYKDKRSAWCSRCSEINVWIKK